ncbi:MAG: hypothetical protein OEO23_08145 [Gemmatimonadota bacterium]|nr:hypothetical protein [Gemmatimonadota bacterium]
MVPAGQDKRIAGPYMRIAADGYIDLGDYRVRTPGRHEERFDPLPLGEGLAFLFSHTFRGHRRVVRAPSEWELSYLQHALWADSLSDRMDQVDRVWRAITEAVTPPSNLARPRLIQVVEFGGSWAYPIHLTESGTQVLPEGGDPVQAVKAPKRVPRLVLDAAWFPGTAPVVTP